MRRFRFPLARLQRLRTHEERAARRRLAAVVAEASDVDARLVAAAANIGVCEAERGAARALAGALAAGYQLQRATLEQRAGDLAVQLEHAQARYRERRRELEGLARLRARRREVWQAANDREERRELDELAVRRFLDGQPGHPGRERR
jgi:flagellar export protein FliJ